MSKKKTHDEFLNELKQKNSTVELIGIYSGNKNKIKTKCIKCGHIWDATPSHLLHGHGCPECAKHIISEKNTWTHEMFIEKLNQINENICINSEYVNMRTFIDCICKQCGHIWQTKPSNLLSGRGCPECGKKNSANKRKLTQIEFENRLKEINPNVEIIDTYKTVKSHIKTKCKTCGHIWEPSGTNLLNGYGCPMCNHNSTSYPEQYIYNVFVNIFGENNVFSRDTKTIGKELDIYVPSKKLAIEYGTWYWHKDKIDEDEIKIQLCTKNNIHLITILDNCPSDFQNTMFWCYNCKLERNEKIFKDLICRILKEFNLTEYYELLDFNKIDIIARHASCKKNTNDFIQELKLINKNITVLGDYKNSKETIKVKCNICNYEWNPSAGNLLSGSGCPNCAGTKKLTQLEFLDKLKQKHPNLTTENSYINSTTSLLFHCSICSTNFEMKPSYLWKTGGCPTCNNIKKKENMHQKHIEKLKITQPNIDILSKCYNTNDNIECKCKICQHIWNDTYNKLIDKYGGCPKCLKKTNYMREYFINENSKILPNVKILKQYTDSRTPLPCKCSICNYEWSSYPYRLMEGHGCPYCNENKKRIAKMDDLGNILSIYDTITSAAKDLKVSKTAISNCCKGKTRTCCGYYWKYLNE